MSRAPSCSGILLEDMGLLVEVGDVSSLSVSDIAPIGSMSDRCSSLWGMLLIRINQEIAMYVSSSTPLAIFYFVSESEVLPPSR